MYPRNYCVGAYHGHGMIAFSLRETANRLHFFAMNGTYREIDADRNIEKLQDMMYGRILEPDWHTVYFHGMYHHEHGRHFWNWMLKHGVQVEMELYDEQVWEEQLLQAANEAEQVVEDAHALWNLYDDGQASQADTDISEITDADVEEIVERMLENAENEGPGGLDDL